VDKLRELEGQCRELDELAEFLLASKRGIVR